MRKALWATSCANSPAGRTERLRLPIVDFHMRGALHGNAEIWCHRGSDFFSTRPAALLELLSAPARARASAAGLGISAIHKCEAAFWRPEVQPRRNPALGGNAAAGSLPFPFPSAFSIGGPRPGEFIWVESQSAARLGNSQPILAENDDRNGRSLGLGDNLQRGGLTVRSGG